MHKRTVSILVSLLLLVLASCTGKPPGPQLEQNASAQKVYPENSPEAKELMESVPQDVGDTITLETEDGIEVEVTRVD